MKPNIEYIKREMERHKWSGNQLAMKMGVSRMEVSRLLRGKRIGGKKCIGGLIKAFPDADMNELFFLGLSGTYSFHRKEKRWSKSRISMISVSVTRVGTERLSKSERKTALHGLLPIPTEHSKLRTCM